MNLIGRKVGWVNKEGLISVQIWTHCWTPHEVCVGTLHVPRNGKIESTVNVTKEDFCKFPFSPASIHFREILEDDTKDMIQQKEESNQMYQYKKEGLEYIQRLKE